MLPIDFENRMKTQLLDEYDSFRACFDRPCYKGIRINPEKVTPNTFFENKLEGDLSKDECRVPWEECGYYYEVADEDAINSSDCGLTTNCNSIDKNSNSINATLLLRDKPGKDINHAAGVYYVQEPSAMLPVNLLGIEEYIVDNTTGSLSDEVDKDDVLRKALSNPQGLRILDLCAAPGGKSSQIAAKMAGRGLLISNEIVKSRADVLSENIERMGIKNCVVISEDPINIKDRFENFFDLVLVDAPCSGEGMFRRVPESIDEWSMENVKMCADRQDYVLDAAEKMLRPGGRIVYSTCTFSYDEDEGSIERFINRHPEYSVKGEMHRIFPHRQRGEGHFAAVIESADKIESSDSSESVKVSMSVAKTYAPYGYEKAAKRDECKLFEEFVTDTLTDVGINRLFGMSDKGVAVFKWNELYNAKKPGPTLVKMKDKLCLVPGETPNLNGIRVVRFGLELGTFQKNRFEPAHALSHYLKMEDINNIRNLTKEEALDYLKGMTVNNNGCNGWTLMCYEGNGLGFGKASGNVIKNHYPKGLRKI